VSDLIQRVTSRYMLTSHHFSICEYLRLLVLWGELTISALIKATMGLLP